MKRKSRRQDRQVPFFARYLRGQELRKVVGERTLKYPSDLDEVVTMKYPSDDDEPPTT